MTTVGLGILGFYLTFLYRAQDVKWIHESSVPKWAVAFLIASIVAGFVLRFLTELGETSKDVLLLYPIALSEASKKLGGIGSNLTALDEIGEHPAFDKERIKSVKKIDEHLDELKKEQREIRENVNTLRPLAHRLSLMGLVRYQLIQGALLTLGAAFAIYVFWNVVFA